MSHTIGILTVVEATFGCNVATTDLESKSTPPPIVKLITSTQKTTMLLPVTDTGVSCTVAWIALVDDPLTTIRTTIILLLSLAIYRPAENWTLITTSNITINFVHTIAIAIPSSSTIVTLVDGLVKAAKHCCDKSKMVSVNSSSFSTTLSLIMGTSMLPRPTPAAMDVLNV